MTDDDHPMKRRPLRDLPRSTIQEPFPAIPVSIWIAIIVFSISMGVLVWSMQSDSRPPQADPIASAARSMELGYDCRAAGRSLQACIAEFVK